MDNTPIRPTVRNNYWGYTRFTKVFLNTPLQVDGNVDDTYCLVYIHMSWWNLPMGLIFLQGEHSDNLDISHYQPLENVHTGNIVYLGEIFSAHAEL